MNNFRFTFNSRRFLAAIFIVNSGIAIGLTNVSASASDLTPLSDELIGGAVSVTYETSSGPQTVTSNEVYVHIQPSPPPIATPPVRIQDSLATQDSLGD